jgi:hypothetical protein
MTTQGPRPVKATSTQGLSNGIAIGAGLGVTYGIVMGGGSALALGIGIGAGLGVAIGAAWDNKHPPTT